MNELSLGSKTFNRMPHGGVVSVHDPITPVEVYGGEPISASLIIRESQRKLGELPIYRLSPLGAEIDVTSFPGHSLKPGSEVDLTVSIAKQTCQFAGITVSSIHEENRRLLVGVRWFMETGFDERAAEKRQHARWLCGDHFLPTGVAPNPARFNDFVYFSVVDVSRKGMQLSTSMRNKFIIPGMVLEAVVSFPLIGQLTLHLRITNARLRAREGREFLALGAELIDNAPEVLETVGQYLLQFGPQLSVAQLRKEGFEIRSAESAIEFSYVKTLQDYRSVLGLRKMAYAKVGKVDADAPIEQMSDIYDAKSRILMARHRGALVGSLRITFHAPDETNEYEQFVTLPPTFPRRDQIAVVSRVCTHPDYRGSDLMYGLIRECVLTVLQSRRRYLLGGGTEKLVPIYERLGFRRQGIQFTHGALNGVKEEVLLADVLNMLSGLDTGPAVWNEIYSDLTSYISHLYDVPMTPEMNLRIKLYRSIAFATKWLTRGSRHPKRQT